MSQRNREKICKCCGKHYLYCYHCDADRNKPKWMTICHDENCLKIFYIVSDYNVGEKTKEECKKMLQSCDLSEKDNFLPNVKAKINEILDIENVVEEFVEKENLNSEQDAVAEPVKESETTNEHNTTTVNTYANKNKFKSSKKYQSRYNK